jgi:plastocyanin
VTNEPGIQFSRKFKKPGEYVLGCILHEDMLMDLKVKKNR